MPNQQTPPKTKVWRVSFKETRILGRAKPKEEWVDIAGTNVDVDPDRGILRIYNDSEVVFYCCLHDILFVCLHDSATKKLWKEEGFCPNQHKADSYKPEWCKDVAPDDLAVVYSCLYDSKRAQELDEFLRRFFCED